MGKVTIERDQQKNLTNITVTGQLTDDDIVKAVTDFYKNPTRLVLWDSYNSDLEKLSLTNLEQASKLIAKVKTDRPEGKTAFVVENHDFGLGVIFETFTKIEGLPYEYRSFTSRDEAMRWLKQACS